MERGPQPRINRQEVQPDLDLNVPIPSGPPIDLDLNPQQPAPGRAPNVTFRGGVKTYTGVMVDTNAK